jgi:hypothetical protein
MLCTYTDVAAMFCQSTKNVYTIWHLLLTPYDIICTPTSTPSISMPQSYEYLTLSHNGRLKMHSCIRIPYDKRRLRCALSAVAHHFSSIFSDRTLLCSSMFFDHLIILYSFTNPFSRSEVRHKSQTTTTSNRNKPHTHTKVN